MAEAIASVARQQAQVSSYARVIGQPHYLMRYLLGPKSRQLTGALLHCGRPIELTEEQHLREHSGHQGGPVQGTDHQICQGEREESTKERRTAGPSRGELLDLYIDAIAALPESEWK